MRCWMRWPASGCAISIHRLRRRRYGGLCRWGAVIEVVAWYGHAHSSDGKRGASSLCLVPHAAWDRPYRGGERRATVGVSRSDAPCASHSRARYTTSLSFLYATLSGHYSGMAGYERRAEGRGCHTTSFLTTPVGAGRACATSGASKARLAPTRKREVRHRSRHATSCNRRCNQEKARPDICNPSGRPVPDFMNCR